MKDQSKTKQVLTQELASLRQKIAEFEQTETKRKQAEESLQRSKAFSDSIIEHSPHAIWVSDNKGALIRLNKACCDLFHIKADEVVGKYNVFQDTIVVEQGYLPLVKRVFEQGETAKFTIEYDSERFNSLERMERMSIVLDVTISPVLDAGGRVIHAIIQHRDITDRKQAEKALLKSEEKFRTIFDNASDGILIVDPVTKKCLQGNAAVCSMLEYTKEEIESLSIYDIHLPKDISFVLDEFEKLAKGEKILAEELLVLRKDGSTFYAHIGSSLVIIGGVNCIVGIFRDITELKRIEAALRASENRYRELSIIDDLTQLYNSRHFYFQLKIELERSNRYEQPLTLLLLDLDNFKAFNDAYGHIEGDQVLMRLGQVVNRCLRQADSAYRYGGEEFTILLPMTTGVDSAVTAERIRTEFKKERFSPVPDQEVHLTVSIGLAQNKPQEDMKAFVHRVDQLMYQAKKNGKDRICPES